MMPWGRENRYNLLSNLGAWGLEGRVKRRRMENMKKWDGWVVVGTKMKSKGKDILIEGVIKTLGRNLALRKLQEIQKDDPAMIPVSNGEGTSNALPL